jgi:hypothetical protein
MANQRNTSGHEERTEEAGCAEQHACMGAGNVAVAPAERGSAEVSNGRHWMTASAYS